VQLVRFVSFSFFILRTAYTVDTGALTSTLHSLALIDIIQFTADKKATSASASIVRLL